MKIYTLKGIVTTGAVSGKRFVYHINAFKKLEEAEAQKESFMKECLERDYGIYGKVLDVKVTIIDYDLI